MDIGKFKKNGEDDSAWLDWLSDSASAEPVELAEATPKTLRPPVQPKGGRVLDLRAVPKRSKKATSAERRNFDTALTTEQSMRQPRSFGATRQRKKDPTVSISIHIPKPQLPKLHVPWVRLRAWLIVGAVVCAALFGGKLLQGQLAKPKQKAIEPPVVVQAELGYRPLVPGARAATEAAPSKPVFNEQRKLYTFHDTLSGANLTIDQQAIPPKLKDNPAEIKKVADKLHASESFTTSQGKVYMFTDEHSGAQRLMLANGKMLMFLQSTKKVETVDWVTYIQTLQ